jgi:beta-mannosidase
MEELEGRLDASAHTRMVQNAVDGGMNTLRVWGGGMFLPEAWYDACDELGVMVYHDMQYAQRGHAPKAVVVQDLELRHQIRRLSPHACIVMWDGCNECRVLMNTPTAVYATFVMTVVAQEDASRVVWPSCPALGWSGGVNRLTSIPNGKPLTTPDKSRTIETHGPYQHGGGTPGVNGDNNLKLFDAHLPVTFPEPQASTGPQLENVFASEFGSSVFSSFESMAPTLDPKHWGVHAGMAPDNCTGGFAKECVGSNVMSDRNYPCDNIIDVYFGSQTGDFDQVGEHVFKKHLWQCMVGQALLLKSNIESRRSTNSFGVIVWQLNEIWPTGGWGSIEYGTVGHTAGQVKGGRWKPLQYWYRASMLSDVVATCGVGGLCYVKNDVPKPFKGDVTIRSVEFATGAATVVSTEQLDMPAGAGVSHWWTLAGAGAAVNGNTTMLMATVTNSAGAVVCENPIAYAPPKHMQLPKAKVTFEVAGFVNDDGSVDVTVASDAFALYVTLTTLAQGRFSDNAMVVLPGADAKLKFLPFGKGDAGLPAELEASLRVEHAASYF